MCENCGEQGGLREGDLVKDLVSGQTLQVRLVVNGQPYDQYGKPLGKHRILRLASHEEHLAIIRSNELE